MSRYSCFEPIASGGMGTVHYGRAISTAGLSRVVAIKRMHGDLARDPRCLAMFRDELRLATRVRHPNVIATLDVVEEQGELLLVMEYVQGESLQALIARSLVQGARLPPAIAVTVICGILQGLEAVHQARNEAGEPLGIVHRDVSPENILVGRDGVARLLDFGIARGAGRKYVTHAGEIKGKPSYLAPEQILNGRAVDRRTDVYSAAVVLWEALTGRRLFDGQTIGVVLDSVLHETVLRPSALVPALPSDLDDVVMRGLSRNPADRFATALDMARALRRACSALLPFEVSDWLEVSAQASLERQTATVRRIETTPLPAKTELGLGLGHEAPRPASAPSSDRPRVAPRLARRVEQTRAWLRAKPNVRFALLATLVAVFGFALGLLVVSTALSEPARSAPPAAAAAAGNSPTLGGSLTACEMRLAR